jgi:hypothetical protein
MFKLNRICDKFLKNKLSFSQSLCLLSSETNVNVSKFRHLIKNGPQLDQFIGMSPISSELNSITEPFVVKRDNNIPYINQNDLNGNGRKGLFQILINNSIKVCLVFTIDNRI